jgi:hypothetical protein
LGWSKVTFESDSKTLVDAVNSKSVGSSEFHVLVSNIRTLLSLNNNFLVMFIHRQANMVSHNLAKSAISNASWQQYIATTTSKPDNIVQDSLIVERKGSGKKNSHIEYFSCYRKIVST